MNCSRAGNARHRTPRRPPRRATSLHHRQSEQFSPSLPGLLMPSRRRSTNCSNLSVTRAHTHTHTHTHTHARTHWLAGALSQLGITPVNTAAVQSVSSQPLDTAVMPHVHCHAGALAHPGFYDERGIRRGAAEIYQADGRTIQGGQKNWTVFGTTKLRKISVEKQTICHNFQNYV